ncbi:MAG: hypothetical protein IKU37_07120 [Candidatus Gastranaerophilales bacterium]|nr:hypothetical protein [Candidatus Gastranaerophilales bacterium]
MEENKQKDFDDKSMFYEDFKDFDEEDDDTLPEIDEDLAMEDEEKDESLNEETEQIIEESSEEQQQNEQQQREIQELSHWEEIDENNSVVKKYIFHISKEFVPYIDKLTTNERNAYINEAIQNKIDLDNEKKQKDLKRKLKIHFVLMCFSLCLFAPVALFIAHKAIMVTFDNYKYSQENFEKLYRERFLKDRAYMRSIQYNKEQEMKKRKQ